MTKRKDIVVIRKWVLVMVLLGVVVGAFSDEVEAVQRDEDFDIQQRVDNTLTITGYRGTARTVVIPETLYGLKVTVIGNRSFEKKDIDSVVIPDTVTAIEQYAFFECKLHTVSIGKNITTIGMSAFEHLLNLTNVILPDSVTDIGERVFARSGLSGITLSNRLEHIAGSAFYNTKLTNISLPSSLKRIGRSAFSGTLVQTLVIPDGVVSVSAGAIPGSVTTVIIPPSLARNAADSGFSQAFENTKTITRITLPANVDERNLFGFDQGFINFWKSQNKKSGTYIKKGQIWIIE
jgi:hypothetical protein